MFFPIGDDNPSRRRPLLTWTLIAANVLVYALVNVPAGFEGGEDALRSLFATWGFDRDNPLSLQLLTSMFLHGGLAHLAGNMWMLWIVGDNVEDKLGRLRFLGLYVGGGILAAWVFVITSSFAPEVREVIGEVATQQAVPLVGASGAIFAVMGTYFAFFPEARIRMLLWFFFFVQVVPVRAKWIIGAWVVQDFVLTLLAGGDAAAGSVATAAHVGGALVGVAFGIFMKPRVGGGGIGDAWDTHTGFASAQDERFRTPWHGIGPRPVSVRPTESQLVAIEDAITRDVRSGRIESALDLYPRYESMDREKPLPGPVQIEIAHEFFRRGLPREALQAYQRYLRTEPGGDDAAEASFRIGVLLGRAFGKPDEARPFLERAARDHHDRGIRDFATAELERQRA